MRVWGSKWENRWEIYKAFLKVKSSNTYHRMFDNKVKAKR